MQARPLGAALGTVFLAIILAPAGNSQEGWILGTEEEPELKVPPGDVKYSTLHQGPKDHAYLDLTTGWFSYDNATDNLSTTLKVVDGHTLANPGRDYAIQCSLYAAIWAEDIETGSLSFKWDLTPGLPGSPVRMNSLVEWQPKPSSGAASANENIALKHLFTSTLEAPAKFSWSTYRPTLLRYGDEARDMSGFCSETYQPVQASLYTNFKNGQSKSVYSIRDLRRLVAPDGSKDPLESAAASPSDTAPTSNAGQSSPLGVEALAAVGIASALAFAWRRR